LCKVLIAGHYDSMSALTRSQTVALASVRQQANGGQSIARRKAERVLAKEGVEIERLDDVLAAISKMAPIDLSFHPDRLDKNGDLVVQSMYDTGRYRNQFETGISNGGLTAFEGGEQDLWEKTLFAGAYQKHSAAPEDRPRYGALNLLNHWDRQSRRITSY